MPVWCLAYSNGIPKLTIRVRGISGPQMAVSRADGNYYKYELSVLHQLPITNLDLLIYGCMCVEMYIETHT